MRLAIVDDEPLARERLRALLGELAAGEVVAEGATGIDALLIAERDRPEVMLLDIRMPGMDGLEAAAHLTRLPQPPAIVFTTAYDEHALAAFDAHAIDYLLKPIRIERLAAALHRAQMLQTAQARLAVAVAGRAQVRTHFSAFVKGGLRIVPVREVRYLQADQGYVTVRHLGGQLLIEDSLRGLEDEFGAALLRVHRNTLVMVEHVAALERDPLGGFSIALRDVPERLPVSRRLHAAVRQRIRG